MKSSPARPSFAGLFRLWPLLLPLFFYFPSLFGYPYPSPEAEYSDIAITHLPNLLFIKDSITTDGTVPLWSPRIFSGTPFAANPLAGLWYPPGWIPLFFPPHIGFSLSSMAHILLGGLGMYLLLRSEGLSFRGSLFGSLAFESLPKLLGHFGAGHLTLVYAVPWTPWLVWLSQPPSYSGRLPFRYLVGPGIVLSMIILADPRWVPLAGIFWLAWVFVHRMRCTVEIRFRSDGLIRIKSWLFQTGWLFIQGGIALLLSAVLLLPFAQFIGLSSRQDLAEADMSAFSLPPARLLGLLYPDFGGVHEWIIYAGGIVVLLALLTALSRQSRRRAWFWGFALLVSVVVALGENTPLANMIQSLPGFSLLRVPSRALFISGFSMAALSAFALDWIESGPVGTETRRARLLIVGFIFFSCSIPLLLLLTGQDPPAGLVWGALISFMGGSWILLKLSKRDPVSLWFPVLVVLALLDWGVLNRTLLSVRDPGKVLEEAAELTRISASHAGGGRVYTPSYSLPQQTSILAGIDRADGVDPLYLDSYREFMDRATGVPRIGYSVSIPPFAEGDPHSDNSVYVPDPALLGLLNVTTVVSDFDINSEEFVLHQQVEGARVYENLAALPRVWLQNVNESAFNPDSISGANLAKEVSNKLHYRVLEATGPGRLVYSEVYFPGWVALVDGREVQIEPFEGILWSVELTAGTHSVEFRYFPTRVFFGLAVSLFTLIAITAFWFGRERIRFIGICNVTER